MGLSPLGVTYYRAYLPLKKARNDDVEKSFLLSLNLLIIFIRRKVLGVGTWLSQGATGPEYRYRVLLPWPHPHPGESRVMIPKAPPGLLLAGGAEGKRAKAPPTNIDNRTSDALLPREPSKDPRTRPDLVLALSLESPGIGTYEHCYHHILLTDT